MDKKSIKFDLNRTLDLLRDIRFLKSVKSDSAFYAFILSAASEVGYALNHLDDIK